MTGTTEMRRLIYGAMASVALGVATLLVLGCGKPAPPAELKVEVEKTPAAAPAASAAETRGSAVVATTSDTAAPAGAIKAAAAKGRYVALVLHKAGAPDARGMAAAVHALAEASGKADFIVADAANPEFAGLFKALNLDVGTMPTPATLVLSTNSIVTGVFTVPPTKERFAEALLPQQPLAVRSALRDGKKAIVIAQSPTTKGNAETDKGVEEYLAGITNRAAFVVVKIALDNAENAPFLKQLKIDPQTETQSVTVIVEA